MWETFEIVPLPLETQAPYTVNSAYQFGLAKPAACWLKRPLKVHMAMPIVPFFCLHYNLSKTKFLRDSIFSDFKAAKISYFDRLFHFSSTL